jgi:CDP-glucose 4,6-dehydratase
MEDLVKEQLFNSVYRGKKVFLTGHTGFKGSWLLYWLYCLGAEVFGYSKDVPSDPSHFELLKLPAESLIADIRDKNTLFDAVKKFQPDIIFHLAAQPLVRYSYQHPLETFETNVLGTANVFEAARCCKSVKAIVNVTSDKAYENLEIDIAYKETDRMGGYDPYSASKGCAELIVNSYRNSFFNVEQYGTTHHILLASARAGNVIGGGDWADDRLIPDIVKASVASKPVSIRYPEATRPWQHVLEPLSGYLLLGQALLEGKKEFADGWNLGPLLNETLSVKDVLHRMKKTWWDLEYNISEDTHPHEAHLLRLDCEKANQKLKWFPVWSMEDAISITAEWYKSYYEKGVLSTKENLERYIMNAKNKQLSWAC